MYFLVKEFNCYKKKWKDFFFLTLLLNNKTLTGWLIIGIH